MILYYFLSDDTDGIVSLLFRQDIQIREQDLLLLLLLLRILYYYYM